MNWFCLLLAIVILLITLYLIKINFNKFRKQITIVLFSLLLTLFVLIFPLISTHSFISKVVTSIIYTIQAIGFNQNLDIVNNIEISYMYEWIYIILIYILFFLIPLTTATFFLSLIESIMSRLRLFFTNKRKLYIFSDLNEKTVSIASKLANINSIIIFIYYDDIIDDILLKKIKDINAIKIYYKTNIKLRNFMNRDVEFYLFSSDISKNLDDSIEIINNYKNKAKLFKMFTLVDSDTNTTILDSMDKGNIRLNIINENERIVYQLLEKTPLYLSSFSNKISVLLISNDKIGIDFLKAITWCGQLIDYKLEITMLSNNAEAIKDYISINCPEMLSNYNYTFINGNLYKVDSIIKLNKIKDINYVIIATSDDNLNIEYSLFLRKYFLKRDTTNYQDSPVINVMVKNDLLSKQVDLLKNEKNNNYHLNAFGSIKNTYCNNYIIDSNLERLARNVHLAYDLTDDPIDIKLKRFYEKEYNVRSSRAMALHLKYKIYSILKEDYSKDDKKNILLFKEKIKDKKIFDKLARNEHDRWMAYLRTNGYTYIDAYEVKKYKEKTNSHIHYLAKLHPCLAPFDELKNIAKIIKKEDIITSDGEIIKKMVDIMLEDKD